MTAPLDLDITRGTEACAGNSELHAQVARLLAADITARISAIEIALHAGNLAEIARQAHKHKGACLAVGAQAMGERFNILDMAARSGDAVAARQSAALLPSLAKAFRDAVAAL